LLAGKSKSGVTSPDPLAPSARSTPVTPRAGEGLLGPSPPGALRPPSPAAVAAPLPAGASSLLRATAASAAKAQPPGSATTGRPPSSGVPGVVRAPSVSSLTAAAIAAAAAAGGPPAKAPAAPLLTHAPSDARLAASPPGGPPPAGGATPPQSPRPGGATLVSSSVLTAAPEGVYGLGGFRVNCPAVGPPLCAQRPLLPRDAPVTCDMLTLALPLLRDAASAFLPFENIACNALLATTVGVPAAFGRTRGASMHKPPALVCEFSPPAHQQRPSLIAAAHAGAIGAAPASTTAPAAVARGEDDDLIAQVEAAIRGEPLHLAAPPKAAVMIETAADEGAGAGAAAPTQEAEAKCVCLSAAAIRVWAHYWVRVPCVITCTQASSPSVLVHSDY
jgi:hypothetical protein